MEQRILVGIDGSRPSQAALEWATRRVSRNDGELVLVHVDESEDGIMGHDFREEQSRIGARLLAEAARTCEEREEPMEVRTQLLDGPMAWTLGRAARPGDLLVVGTHKTGFLSGRVLGSRSVQAAIAAPCSVAVIPDVDLRFRRGVVAGIDRVETAALIATAAADEAQRLGDDLWLIQSGTGVSARESEALGAAAEAVRPHAPGLVVRRHRSSRGPADALLDAARDKALLVLGPGSTDPHRSPIGSVLHQVLLNANAPVLVVRPA